MTREKTHCFTLNKRVESIGVVLTVSLTTDSRQFYEIPCVYTFAGIFDDPRKQVDLLDVSKNPAIRAEDDPGTARSKQTMLKRKKVKSNDCNKKPRK